VLLPREGFGEPDRHKSRWLRGAYCAILRGGACLAQNVTVLRMVDPSTPNLASTTPGEELLRLPARQPLCDSFTGFKPAVLLRVKLSHSGHYSTQRIIVCSVVR
jgi:hypothetical protein